MALVLAELVVFARHTNRWRVFPPVMMTLDCPTVGADESAKITLLAEASDLQPAMLWESRSSCPPVIVEPFEARILASIRLPGPTFFVLGFILSMRRLKGDWNTHHGLPLFELLVALLTILLVSRLLPGQLYW